jgi:hypothetical protein
MYAERARRTGNVPCPSQLLIHAPLLAPVRCGIWLDGNVGTSLKITEYVGVAW